MTERLQLTRPDDWHLHFRDGEALAVTVPATARVFGRGIVMPNLNPPITTVAGAQAYRARILEAVPSGSSFEPLMTLYLTDVTSADELRRAADSEFIHACKYYPAGATTNSEGGVTAIERLDPSLEVMQEVGLPLLVHGEVTANDVDIFDRESVFIDRVLSPLVERFPKLKVVFEHITTKEAAQFVIDAREGIAATITPQHLLMNRGDLLVGGLKPHNYCLPVLKRSIHQAALQAAAVSGSSRFFLGTDSAPHAQDAKENACGCAGCYTAPFALPLYASFFDGAGALDRFEGFASHHGADFYGLPRNDSTVTLVRKPEMVPAQMDFLPGRPIVPYWAGRELPWTMAN